MKREREIEKRVEVYMIKREGNRGRDGAGTTKKGRRRKRMRRW